MANQFNGFRAAVPIARHTGNHRYAFFFCIYSEENKKSLFRFSKGINKLIVKDHKLMAMDYAAAFQEALTKGWNPPLNKLPLFSTREMNETNVLTFSDALDHALASKKIILSKYSMYDYNGAARFIKEAAKKTGTLNGMWPHCSVNLSARFWALAFCTIASPRNPGTRYCSDCGH